MKKKIWISILVVSLIIVMVGVSIYRQTIAKGPKVELKTVSKEKIAEHLMVPGTVSMDQEQKVYYSPEKGNVSKFLVKEGQLVEKGDPLILYDQPQLSMELEQSKLAIESAHLRLEQINKQISDLNKQKKDLEKTVGVEQATKQIETEKNNMQTEKKIADIELKQAQLQKENLEKQKKNLTVVSKVSGTVLSINTKVADQSGTSEIEPILVVGQLGSLTATGYITEYDSIKVKKGQSVKLKSDALIDQEWSGQISFLSLIPKENVASAGNEDTAAQYPLKVKVNDNNNLLRPGFQLIMEIVTEEKETLTIPLEAIITKGNEQFVFSVNKNKAQRTKVNTGITSADKIEILDGLTENQKVIVNPPDSLKDGMEVTVK